jgi:hypothetical protein
MITSCPLCGVRLYIHYYPDAKTLVKARCPECLRLIKLWFPGWTLPEDTAAAMAALIRHKARLDKMIDKPLTIAEEVEAEFEIAQALVPPERLSIRSNLFPMSDDY